MKAILFRLFANWKGLAFLIALIIGVFLHLYTKRIVDQLREESRSLVQFYAQMHAKVTETDEGNDLSFLFDEFIMRTNFPLIMTDPEKNPIGWKGILIDENDNSPEAKNRVRKIIERLDRDIDPIPVTWEGAVFNYIYYGDSRLIQQLQWLPFIEMGIIGLFILIGYIGYANMKRSEQRFIWVGMAKETAHQLGTPLSSLLGWLEIIRSGGRKKNDDIYHEMERDLRRLQQVTDRFSQIGSKPDLKACDVSSILHDTAEYIRIRAPQLGRRVEIREHLEKMPMVRVNSGLFQWAIENLLKNSLDAMDKKNGNIEISAMSFAARNRIYIEIKDNGRGIDQSERRKIFNPGFTTKKRGWGLGLNLSKRIIEEYHGGKLFLKESRSSWGTVMGIEIKA